MLDAAREFLLRPWLIGDLDLDGPELARRVRTSATLVTVVANTIGAGVVAAFAVWALPRPHGIDSGTAIPVDLVAGALYICGATAIGVLWGRRRAQMGPDGTAAWLEGGREPSAAQRRAVLRAPVQIMWVQAVLWGVATIVFAGINAAFSPLLGLGVGMTVALGGVTTSAAAYLAAELALRPIAARALAAGPTDRAGVPGVAARWLLAWALGTGAPIAGLVAVGIVGLTDVPIGQTAFAITTVVLGTIAIVFGALVAALAAYATVQPIASIRRGLELIGAGELEVSVPVWDSTEMGLLQSGFNEMAAGLRERERIRDIFGRQVGREAARAALAVDNPELGGTVTEVAVLFVDVVGSTGLAATRPPQEVVALLNRFFGIVVGVVDEHGGWVNKFEGDAALAIFGAPSPLADKEAAALAAGRRLGAALGADGPGLAAAVGIASGEVVAGHVGAESRFEYTVIGDPVNVAARLTELAKELGHPVLASTETLAAAPAEDGAWTLLDPVRLRGREELTGLAVPAAGR
jgi:adenylate cyclase